MCSRAHNESGDGWCKKVKGRGRDDKNPLQRISVVAYLSCILAARHPSPLFRLPPNTAKAHNVRIVFGPHSLARESIILYKSRLDCQRLNRNLFPFFSAHFFFHEAKNVRDLGFFSGGKWHFLLAVTLQTLQTASSTARVLWRTLLPDLIH
jgi:hypothetical protein